MNEPVFTLDDTPHGARRSFADPLAPPPDGTPSRRSIRARLLAAAFETGAAASRRLFPVRS